MKLLRIRELKIDDTDETGVQAISLVDYPAIEENFIYLAANKRQIKNLSDITEADLNYKYKWILGAETDVCPACIEWSKKSPMTLKKWVQTALPRVPINETILGIQTKKSWDGQLSPEHTGPIYNTFCEDKCRCYLQAVEESKETFNVEFKIDNDEKREIVGLVLCSNKLIYRHDVGGGPGYVYFTSRTIEEAQRKFGYNRNITFQHVQNKTGSVILMKSWIEHDKDETRWMVRYKVIDNGLWEQIKKGTVKGFSLEGQFK